ncbi:hypothetical protein SSCG_06307 [Streptomyces clavuligerus]|nr:hypothetical protein SSCG_06307 [Streptomyces clavuligerus]
MCGSDDRWALALYASTCLPLVVAITTIGLGEGVIDSGEASAMVGRGPWSPCSSSRWRALRLRAERAEAGAGGRGMVTGRVGRAG